MHQSKEIRETLSIRVMKLIKLNEAAERAGVSRQTMTNWGLSGAIKIRKMGERSSGYWVDADTIDAMADTMEDIEKTKTMLASEQEELRKQYKEEHDTLRDIQRELFMAKKFGTGLMCKEFYLAIPKMLQELGVLKEREAGIMVRIIGGDNLGWIADDYGLSRTRISQIFFKGCRKARELENLKDTVDKAIEQQDELEYLRKKMKEKESYIMKLEDMLNMKHTSDVEIDRSLEMKRLVDCNLSVRALNCLKSIDFETVGDLVKVRRGELLKIRCFGRKTLTELDEFLDFLGLEWGTKFLIPVRDRHGWLKGYRLSDTNSE